MDNDLLARHRDPEGILGRHEVIGIVRSVLDRELDAFDFAVERIAARAVVLSHRRAGIAPDVTAVVRRKDHGRRRLDPALADLLAVDEK